MCENLAHLICAKFRSVLLDSVFAAASRDDTKRYSDIKIYKFCFKAIYIS